MIKIDKFSRGEEPHCVEAEVVFCGDDLVITVGGGSRYHTGAIAVAYPHTSIIDPSHTTVTTSVITVPGHKEDEIARSAARLVASKKNRTVTVAVGMHIDHASQEDIDRLVTNFEAVIKDVLESF